MGTLFVKHRKIGTRLVVVDDSDYERVKPHRWLLFKRRKVYYVRAMIDGKQTLLHRYITEAPEDLTVDHADGDPLNNSRMNLVVCTNQENVSAGWRRGAYAIHSANTTHSNTVKKRLADGTIKTYKYDRRDHQKWDEKGTKTSN